MEDDFEEVVESRKEEGKYGKRVDILILCICSILKVEEMLICMCSVAFVEVIEDRYACVDGGYYISRRLHR